MKVSYINLRLRTQFDIYFKAIIIFLLFIILCGIEDNHDRLKHISFICDSLIKIAQKLFFYDNQALSFLE
jgi:hypothetical protein